MHSGEIAPGDVIAEATSGNTGISFAAIGRALGHPVRIYMPDWMSRERVLVIQSLGAAVIPGIRGAGRLPRLDPHGRRFRARGGPRVPAAAVRQHRQRAGALRDHRSRDHRATGNPGPQAHRLCRRCRNRRHGHGRGAAPARDASATWPRIRSSRRIRPRCAPVTRSAGIASRASATNSCPPSSSWASSAASSTCGMATPS